MKNKRGITLIALIITIITLLLLAGVTINTLSGNGGILENSEKAVGLYNNSVNKEQEEINKLEEYLNKNVSNSIKGEFEKDPGKYKNPSQSTEDSNIAISEDGESVNLDLWEYTLRTNAETGDSYYELVAKQLVVGTTHPSGYPAYKGDIQEGAIIGKIPAYIYNADSGTVVAVESLQATFSRLSGLTECPRIPSTVSSIGQFTFYRCNLTSITIPSSVTNIGYMAFGECLELERITIPRSVLRLDGWAFRWWTSSQTIYYEGDATPEGWSAFWRSSCDARVFFAGVEQ